MIRNATICLCPADVMFEVLQSTYPLFDDACDQLKTYPMRDAVRVQYHSARASSTDADVTLMELVHFFTARHLWIGQLTVSRACRGQGIGSSLALAAEEVGAVIGADSLLVYPLAKARMFWSKLDYQSSASMSRVMFKRLRSGNDRSEN